MKILICVLLWAVVLDAYGRGCIDASNGTLQIDYPTVEITPDLRLNGNPFVTTAAQSVQIWLAQDGILQVLLGETHLPTLPVNVIAGVYDLVYRDITPDPAPLLPANNVAVVQSDVAITSDGVLVVDVITGTLSSSVTINGVAFPMSAAEDANIFAVGTEGQGEVFFYNTQDQSGTKVLIAGEYEVVYRHESGSSIVPFNQNAVVDTVVVSGATNISTDILSHETSGQFFFNGVLAPDSLAARGAVEMRRVSGSGLLDTVYLNDTNDQSYTRQIIANRYQVFYQGITGFNIAPANTDSAVPGLGNVQVNGSVIDIDIPVTIYQGDILVNSATPPDSAAENGELWILDRDNGSETFLNETRDGAYLRALMPGNYDLVYRVVQASQLVPLNEFKVFATNVPFPGETTNAVQIDLDVPMTTATFDITLDGQPWNAGAGEATVRLFDATRSGQGTLSYVPGTTNNSPWSASLVSGPYVAQYSHESGNGIPRNLLTELPDQLSVDGFNDSDSIQLNAIDLTPSALINGNAWPLPQQASLSLLYSGGLVAFGTGQGSWPARRALQGEYVALYGHGTGDDIPLNLAHQQNCVNAEPCLFCDGFES